MRQDAFMVAIDVKKAEYADAWLTKPIAVDAASYGRAIGHYGGLEEAKQIWIKLRDEDAEKDKKL